MQFVAVPSGSVTTTQLEADTTLVNADPNFSLEFDTHNKAVSGVHEFTITYGPDLYWNGVTTATQTYRVKFFMYCDLASEYTSIVNNDHLQSA